MNDLEICKRIAEIEGVDVMMHDCPVMGNRLCRSEVVCGLAPQPYNPLTDKALCFDLMVKYRLAIHYSDDLCIWVASIGVDGFYDKDPQRAICLAIIAKYEAQND